MIITVFVITVFLPMAGFAQEVDFILEQQLEKIELQSFDYFWEDLQREAGGYLLDFHWRDFFQWFRTGEFREFAFMDLISGLGRYLFGEVLFNLSLLGQLIILAVMAALLKNLQTAFGREQVEQLIQSVIFLMLMGLAIKSFLVAMEIGREAINQMADFMLAIIPVLLVLLASLGSFSTAAIFHPLIIFSVIFFSQVARDIIFPLIFFSAALTMISFFSPHFKLNHLADFFRTLSIWGLGLLLTLFVGIMAIQGVAGTVADAVGFRAAKFAVVTFVPVVGKMLAEAVETVAGVSLLLKNCVNVTGLLILVLITVFPLLKLLSLVLIYKVAAALVQTLGDTPLGECLNAMGDCLMLLFSAVATVSLLFFVSITIIIGAGNALLMLR